MPDPSAPRLYWNRAYSTAAELSASSKAVEKLHKAMARQHAIFVAKRQRDEQDAKEAEEAAKRAAEERAAEEARAQKLAAEAKEAARRKKEEELAEKAVRARERQKMRGGSDP